MLATSDYTCSAGGRGDPNPGSADVGYCINNALTFSATQTGHELGMTIGGEDSDSDMGSSVDDMTSLEEKHGHNCEKAPHLVARRNARERRRVQAVNNAFCCLRRHIPYENRHKRLSKVKTLRYAIDYIKKMQDMLENYDVTMFSGHHSQPRQKVPMVELTSSRENAGPQRWLPIDLAKAMHSGTYAVNNPQFQQMSYGSTSY